MATINDPTEQYNKNVHQFLDYMATYPNAVVIFHASDMILRANTDASYLTEPEARSHTAGFFLREHAFKMFTGAPEWPNTYKLQNFKLCCRFFCKSINWRIFCYRKIWHHSMKHIRINGPPKAHYTSMHIQYDQKTFKTFSLHGK